MKKSKEAPVAGLTDLEFPDWSGMLPHRSRKTFEEAVRWNDEMLSLFRPRKKSPEPEALRRCHAEFVL
jgi:hypothetical protein